MLCYKWTHVYGRRKISFCFKEMYLLPGTNLLLVVTTNRNKNCGEEGHMSILIK